MTGHKLIIGDKFVAALVELGIVDEPERVHRVVIDCKVGEPINVHVEKYGDERLLVLLDGAHVVVTEDAQEAIAR